MNETKRRITLSESPSVVRGIAHKRIAEVNDSGGRITLSDSLSEVDHWEVNTLE